MRNMILVLLASVGLLGGGSSVALADGMVLPLPEALSPDYLVVRYHHVQVAIEDGHAVTRVEQEFHNPHDFAVTGQYLFPVPPDAVLSGFQATVDGLPQKVSRQDVATTNAALFGVIAQQHDPSLLQYADWESLAFDLSLQPGASRQMSLEYEEVLAPTGGLYRYRYVLSTERYSAQPLEEVSVVIELRSSSGLASLYSSSHPIAVERLGTGHVRVSWRAQHVRPTEDFELFFSPAEGGYGGGLLTGERNGLGHFLFLFSPEAEPQLAGHLPKDIVFVIDRSGSMDGVKIEQARNALKSILGQLGSGDRFSIVAFNERLSLLKNTLLPVEKGTLQDARAFVDRLSADGHTDLEAALQAGLEILDGREQRGASRMLIFLTDGLPTSGITEGETIASLVASTNARLEARLHVFGVGYDVNTHLLDQLAGDNGGTVTYVQPGENLELALTDFYNKIAHPVLTDVQVQYEGLQVSELYPQFVPDLFQGSSLLLTGRYEAKSNRFAVRVSGWAGDERRDYIYHFDLADTGDHDFVPRLWATRRVGVLLDRIRIQGQSPALVQEIRSLGLSYGIVTPYTIAVIESQAEGAASAANQALYGSADLNLESGQTTVMARVQNQAYQQAAQASLAAGANVLNSGPHSLAQVGMQNVDLSLLKDLELPEGPGTDEWLEGNLRIDRTVKFGSEEYFALAEDPGVRPFLQSGRNVIFAHQGKIVSVEDLQGRGSTAAGREVLMLPSPASPGPSKRAHLKPGPETVDSPASLAARQTAVGPAEILIILALCAAGIVLLGTAAVAAVVWLLLRPRLG